MAEPTIRRADELVTVTVDGAVATPTTTDRTPGPVAEMLERSSPVLGADHVTVHSGDGLFTASIPLDVVRVASLGDDGRLTITDAPTRCWLVKDVRRLEVTVGSRPDSLPAEERAKL